MLKNACLSTMGQELVDKMTYSTRIEEISQWLQQICELQRVMEEEERFPLQYFFDMRTALARIRLENTHLEEEELFDLRRSLDTIFRMVNLLRQGEDGENLSDETPNGEDTDTATITYRYPVLSKLTEKVTLFPQILQRIDQILDKLGHIRDNATPALAQIRMELKRAEGSVPRTLNSILRTAQSDGLVDQDVAPTLRDGRLVIPIAPGMKRKIKGIVHDESATGRTVFIEPTEVVEANNRIRELETEERKEVIRILTAVTQSIRPRIPQLLQAYRMLGNIEFIYAKAQLAKQTKAIAPTIEAQPLIDWIGAVHPLLRQSLAKQGKKVVPLDITPTYHQHSVQR